MFKLFSKKEISRNDLLNKFQKNEKSKGEKWNKKVLIRRENIKDTIWITIKKESSLGNFKCDIDVYNFGIRVDNLDDFYYSISTYDAMDGKEWFEKLKSKMKSLGYDLSVKDKTFDIYCNIYIEVKWDKNYSKERK